jgi:hypothetical protein
VCVCVCVCVAPYSGHNPAALITSLFSLSRFQALYAEGERRLNALDGFVRGLEDRIMPLLRKGQVPQKDLVQAIAAAKVGVD